MQSSTIKTRWYIPWVCVLATTILLLALFITFLSRQDAARKTEQTRTALQATVQTNEYQKGNCIVKGKFLQAAVNTPEVVALYYSETHFRAGSFYGEYKDIRWGFYLEPGEVAEMFEKDGRLFVKITRFDPNRADEDQETEVLELFDVSS